MVQNPYENLAGAGNKQDRVQQKLSAMKDHLKDSASQVLFVSNLTQYIKIRQLFKLIGAVEGKTTFDDLFAKNGLASFHREFGEFSVAELGMMKRRFLN